MFNDVRIKVGFQPKLQLKFRYTIVNVKPRFMAMSLLATPEGLLPKVESVVAPMLFGVGQLTCLPPDVQST
jgi:hypothetical protein